MLGALHDRVDAGHGGIESGAGAQITADVFDVAVAVTTPAPTEDAHIRAR
jgi:hypothetical protein